MIKKLKIAYIFKMSSILLVQLVTITIGVVYRISSYFSKKFSVNFSGIYLILNTMDGVLFPLSFIVSSGMHKLLIKIITGKAIEDNEETETNTIEDYDNDENDNDNDNDNDINNHNYETEKNIPMQDLSKKDYDSNDTNEPNFNEDIGSINE